MSSDGKTIAAGCDRSVRIWGIGLADRDTEDRRDNATSQSEPTLEWIENVVAKRREKFGEDHLLTLTAMRELARHYARVGQFDRSIAMFEKLVDLDREKAGGDHLLTLTAMQTLAKHYARAGQFEQLSAMVATLPGNRLVSTSFDESLGIWQLEAHATGADGVAYSSNGRSGGYGGRGRIDSAVELRRGRRSGRAPRS